MLDISLAKHVVLKTSILGWMLELACTFGKGNFWGGSYVIDEWLQGVAESRENKLF